MVTRKLKICIVTGDFPALTETFVTAKVLELSRRGHAVTVISNRTGGQLNTSHLSVVKSAGIKVLPFTDLSSVKDLAKTIFKRPVALVSSISATRKDIKKNYKTKLQEQFLRQDNFDIVHFEFSGLASSYFNALKGLPSKVVVSCRGTAEKVKPLTVPGRKELLAQLFAKADAIHCVSDDMAETVKEYLNSSEKIFVNRPAIDLNVFNRKGEYQNGHFQIQVLSVGRFTFQKGYWQGLMAMRSLKLKGVPFVWKIVGDGPLKEEIIYHIHTLGLQDCVELLGKKNRDEILALYEEADIFLLPSLYEGIANVCLEAMAMQLPVVATKSGGMEEVIDDGVNGLLCEVYSPDSIEEKLMKLLDDFELRRSLGVAARKKVVENYTIERQADIFEEQYYNLVNHSH